MIGLKRHAVRLVEHDPAWASLFDAESEVIRAQLPDRIVDIQHVGSTAVAGLPAKPILDIAVATPSREAIPCLVERLTAIGYIDRGDGGDNGGYLLVKEPEPDVRTVHLHIVEQTDQQWQDYIDFRDTLRRNEGLRQKYADLKRTLAEKFQADRKSYTAAKNKFISEVLDGNREARQDGSPLLSRSRAGE